MNGSVLIVGGGPAGLSAAHALASAGRRVALVEKEDRLGGAPILSAATRGSCPVMSGRARLSAEW